MTELIIEDVSVDLGEANIQINYSIAKIGEIESRSGARSAQINLPKTAKNRLVFENSGDVNSISLKPYRRLKARLKVDGIDQRILFASLESVSETYNVRVYGENVSFFDIIKSKKLIELDLKQYDHYRTFANIKDGRSRTQGYLYPVIDYHTDSPNLYFDNSTPRAYVQYLYPAMYYEDCLNQICVDAGYTLINRLTELADYPTEKLCIPYSSVKFERNNDMRRYDATIISTVTNDSGSTASPAYIKINDFEPYGYRYYDTSSPSFFTNLTVYSVDIIDNIQCDVELRFNATNNTGIDLIGRISFLNDTNVYTFTILAGATSDFTINATDLIPYYVSGVGASLQVFLSSIGVNGTNQSPSAITLNTFACEISNSTLLEFNPDVIYDDTDIKSFVTCNSLLPDWTQAELLSNYLKMFCGLITVNEFDKTVTLFSFETINANINDGKDWSDKIDLSNESEMEFSFDYAQNNSLAYAEDKTVIKPTGTDSEILIDDDNLEGFGKMVELKFAATENVVRLVGEHVSQIKMWSNVGSADANMELVNQRVLVVKFEDFGFDYTDGLTTQTVTTDIPVCYFIQPTDGYAVDFNLGFGNNLDRYYQTFASVLDKTKILNLNLRLNASDINQLDFTKPVYISHFNSWFYISQIKGYVPNNYESTGCELVKLF